MAITISQQPQAWTPAYNDQWITALSTEIAQPNFKYYINTYVTYDLNGTPTTDTYLDEVFPRPDGYLVFNPKEKVKNYVKNFFKPNDYTIVEAINEMVSVSIDISETWTGQTPTATETITYNAWNACLTEKQMYDYDYTDYISNSSVVRLHSVATSGPDSIPFEKQTFNSDVYLQFVKTAEIDVIGYQLLDTNGVDIIDDTELTGSMTNDKIYQANVSPQYAESLWGGVVEGMYIKVDFYSVDYSGAHPVYTSLYSYTYLIEDLCTKYDINRVYYLNRRGGVSSFPFEQMSIDNIDNKTNEVRLNRNEIVSGIFTYKPYQHENRVVSTQEIFKKSLITNWITETESKYLEELFSSPLKWIVNESEGYGDAYAYIPVTTTSAPYVIGKRANNKLINYKLDVIYSTQETRQRA